MGQALATVAGRFPQAKAVIYDTDGQVRKVHQLFLNGQQLGASDLDRSVAANDRVDLMTAIAGG